MLAASNAPSPWGRPNTNPSLPSAGPGVASWEVLDLLAALVDKSLVMYEELPDGTGRYRLLETVLQYSLERLWADDGDPAPLRARHADFYLTFAENAAQHLRGPDAAQWLDTLEAEHDNLRAALDWFKEDANGGQNGLRLVTLLAQFWFVRGYYAEARSRCKSALEHAGAQEPTLLRARALSRAAGMARDMGDSETAYAMVNESLTIAETLGETEAIADARTARGLFYNGDGNLDAARADGEEAMRLYRILGNRTREALTLNNLGNIAGEQNDWDAAADFFDQSRTILEADNNIGGLIYPLTNLADAHLIRAEREQAESASLPASVGEGEDTARAALAYCQTLGHRKMTGELLRILAKAAGLRGSFVRAARLQGAADWLLETIGYQYEPIQAADRDRLVARLRAALPEDIYEAACTSGQAMHWEAAIEYALSPSD